MTTQQRTTQDSRRAVATRTARALSPLPGLVSSGRTLGCPRRYQRPDQRLGGSSHQLGPGVPWGSEPEPQRLWPSYRRCQPLAGEHPQEQKGEARGHLHRGQHVQGRRDYGEHVEAAHQKAEAAVLVSSIVPPTGHLRKTVQVSLQYAKGRRCRLSITLTPLLPRAVHRGNTCTGTKCILATVAREGWCSTSSLLLASVVAGLATTSLAPSTPPPSPFPQ